MKSTLVIAAVIGCTLPAAAQNVGINTNTPGSTLSINGSFSAGYTAVTTDYTLTATDYVVMYNGTSDATFSLPPAMALGSGNFKGRMYRIKNNSDFLLSIDPAGNERIFREEVAFLKKGNILELISTGLTSGSTWDALGGLSQDSIRRALETVGCTSCPAYDGAATNNWVQITGTEYAAIQSGLPGTGTYGATPSTMAEVFTSSLNWVATMTQNFTLMTRLPAAYYPVALSVKTGSAAPATMAGLRLMLSNTAQNASYAYFGLPLPNVSALAAKTIYYFVLKRPTGQALTGAPSNMALFQSSFEQVGLTTNTSTFMYYGDGVSYSYTNPGQTYYAVPQFQILATGSKGW